MGQFAFYDYCISRLVDSVPQYLPSGEGNIAVDSQSCFRCGLQSWAAGCAPYRSIRLTAIQVYSSPWQPEFYDWAFTYPRQVDRFNPSPPVVKNKAANPIPNHPEIDIMLTHGPPRGILDETDTGEQVGCDHLLRAVTRCKPRLHCFGHIHEGWGAGISNWDERSFEKMEVLKSHVFDNRCAAVDVSEGGQRSLKWGQETLFVNASVMDVRYNPTNAPWLIDIDLPMKQGID